MRRLLVPALTLALLLAAPAAAGADTGSLTLTKREQVGDIGTVGVSVGITKTTCATPSYCGWFVKVTRVGAGQPCTPDFILFLGETREGTGSFTESFPSGGGVNRENPRLCLYLREPEHPEALLAVLDVPFDAPPAPPQPPPPDPEPTPEPKPPLSVKTARKHVAPILTQVFKARFKQRRGFSRTCRKTARDTVVCKVRWRHGRLRFAGPLAIFAAPDEPNGVSFDERIRKTRIRG